MPCGRSRTGGSHRFISHEIGWGWCWIDIETQYQHGDFTGPEDHVNWARARMREDLPGSHCTACHAPGPPRRRWLGLGFRDFARAGPGEQVKRVEWLGRLRVLGRPAGRAGMRSDRIPAWRGGTQTPANRRSRARHTSSHPGKCGHGDGEPGWCRQARMKNKKAPGTSPNVTGAISLACIVRPRFRRRA